MKMGARRQTATLSVGHKAEFFQGGRYLLLLSPWCHRGMKTIDLNASCFKAIKTAVHNNFQSWKSGKKCKLENKTLFCSGWFDEQRYVGLFHREVTELQKTWRLRGPPPSKFILLLRNSYIHPVVKATSRSSSMRDITFYIVLVLAHLLTMQHWINTDWANPRGQAQTATSLR